MFEALGSILSGEEEKEDAGGSECLRAGHEHGTQKVLGSTPSTERQAGIMINILIMTICIKKDKIW